jgi:hypothetical protein
MTRQLLLSLGLLLTACGASYRPPVVTPPRSATYTIVVHVCDGTPCEAGNEPHKVPEAQVEIEANGTVYVAHADLAGNLAVHDLVAGTRSVCAGGASTGYTRACLAVALPRTEGQDVFLLLERDVPPILPLTADGRIFRAGGEPWRYKGVSSFQLLDLYARGGDWRGFLAAYDQIRINLGLPVGSGYNLVRVWPYVPRADWHERAWDSPAPDVVVAFLADVARAGWYVEITLLTDDDPARIDQARQLVRTLAAARPPNLLVEIGNEPQVHKHINTRALQADLDASGLLYASGDPSAFAFGSYVTAHTGRTADWSRRAHDLYELWTGGGPDATTDPAHKVPAVADEPPKPADVPQGMTVGDVRAYFGAAALMGAGATWHCESGKYAQPPTPDEAALAAVALEAMNAFPADAPLSGGYRRIVEPGNEPGGSNQNGRTYVVGPYMVRSQQRGAAAPEPGWTALDAEGVLWRR